MRLCASVSDPALTLAFATDIHRLGPALRKFLNVADF